jgi:hypothetical protein
MNPKKANWLFLSTLCFEAIVVIGIAIFSDRIQLGMISSLIVSQLVLFIPTALFLLCTHCNPFKLIQHKRLQATTILMIVGFTFLCMPLIILVNMISMLFVDNVVSDMMDIIVSASPLWAILVVGVLGPLNEEFVFRGVIYHTYRSKGRIIGGMLLSALLFGLTHLNFNQMSYAILVGIIAVLLIECTGSIWASMVFHMVINLSNTVPVFLFPELLANSDASVETQLETMHMTYREMVCMEIAVYAVIATITTALALCLLYAIAQREGRIAHMKTVWTMRKEGPREKLCSIPLVIAILLCVIYMTLDVMSP